MILLISGLLLGSLITLFVLYKKAPSLMMLENESKYTFEKTEENLAFAIEEAGWKLLGEHDLQAKMKANGYDVIEAKVFDVCKPAYASQVLAQEKERIATPLMPCRIAIYKRRDGKTYVGRMNSLMMSKPMPGVIPIVMGNAARDVEQIIDKIVNK